MKWFTKINLTIALVTLAYVVWMMVSERGIGGIIIAIMYLPPSLLYLLVSLFLLKHLFTVERNPEKFQVKIDKIETLLLVLDIPLLAAALGFLGYNVYFLLLK